MFLKQQFMFFFSLTSLWNIDIFLLQSEYEEIPLYLFCCIIRFLKHLGNVFPELDDDCGRDFEISASHDMNSHRFEAAKNE